MLKSLKITTAVQSHVPYLTPLNNQPTGLHRISGGMLGEMSGPFSGVRPRLPTLLHTHILHTYIQLPISIPLTPFRQFSAPSSNYGAPPCYIHTPSQPSNQAQKKRPKGGGKKPGNKTKQKPKGKAKSTPKHCGVSYYGPQEPKKMKVRMCERRSDELREQVYETPIFDTSIQHVAASRILRCI